jgi:hypothetical protein
VSAARAVGGVALLAVVLASLPREDTSPPVVPESVLCDHAVADTVWPDTLETRALADADCARLFLGDLIGEYLEKE